MAKFGCHTQERVYGRFSRRMLACRDVPKLCSASRPLKTRDPQRPSACSFPCRGSWDIRSLCRRSWGIQSSDTLPPAILAQVTASLTDGYTKVDRKADPPLGLGGAAAGMGWLPVYSFSSRVPGCLGTTESWDSPQLLPATSAGRRPHDSSHIPTALASAPYPA